ncbi:MAG: DUF4418 family protein [Ruminiclostridium sp.]|nr:DUF4418 family protein [Ruminiclostridium sp.]
MKKRISGVIMTALSLLLTIGIIIIFPACGPKEDGSWMMCHWAGRAVFGMGIALTVISLIALIFGGGKPAAGASLSAMVLAVLTALTPEILIPLCKMPTMQCHAMMRPAIIVISVLIALTAAVNAVMILKRKDER